MKPPTSSGSGWLLVVICLIGLAAVGPALVALAGALLPLVIVVAVALIAVRLTFFHTRRF